MTLQLWQLVKMKCDGNEFEAAQILYRAKSADNIEAYIYAGFQRGYIWNPCGDEENATPKVKQWIEKFLVYIAKKGF